MDCDAIQRQMREGPWVSVGTEDAVKVRNTQTGNELMLLRPVGLVRAGLVRALATADDTLFAATQRVLGLCGLNDAEAEPILRCSCHDNYVRLYDLPTFAERGKLFAKREVRVIQIGPAGTGLFFTGDATGQITVWKLDVELKMSSPSS